MHLRQSQHYYTTLSDVFNSPDIEDSLLLKQNWPVMAKRRRNAPLISILGDVRTFTVRGRSRESGGGGMMDKLRDERPRKHDSIPSRNFLVTTTFITTPRARTTSPLTLIVLMWRIG